MAKREPSVSLAKYKPDYVQARADALESLCDGPQRIQTFDRYQDYYNLDIWADPPEPGQVRVTSTAAHQTVEDFTALLVTRRHAINVRSLSGKDANTSTAQDVEGWLYGFRHRTQLDRMLRFQTHDGVKLGEGLLRAWYDSQHAADEFPIRVRREDPRGVYARENNERTRYVELAQCTEQARRTVEAEWDVTLARPSSGFETDEQEDAWLDELVKVTEYFDEAVVFEEREPEPEDEPLTGALETAVEMLTGEVSPLTPTPLPSGEREKGRRVRTRRVVHCVVVDGEEGPEWAKKPVVLVGYDRIPFFPWSWELGPDGRQSALFVLTNGKGENNALGTIQAWNRFMSLFLTIAEKVANPPLVTDDEGLEVDATPGAINYKKVGAGLEYLSSPGVHPNVQMALEELKRQMSAVTVPDVLRGFVVNMSGQAITASASQFEIRIGFAQQDMEMMLASLYEFVLRLARQYYDEDPEAWTAHGPGKAGNDVVQAKFNPEWVLDKMWVEVKTSSSLPKDTIGMMGLVMQLVQGKLLSRRAGIDLMQKYMSTGADTPDDMLAQILEDEILTGGQVGQALANELAQGWLNLMTGRLSTVNAQEVQRSEDLTLNGAGGPGGFEPTNGMPPSVMPPMPDAVGAAGNLAGMQAMMAQNGRMA